jgi:hypothetical protein
MVYLHLNIQKAKHCTANKSNQKDITTRIATEKVVRGLGSGFQIKTAVLLNTTVFQQHLNFPSWKTALQCKQV